MKKPAKKPILWYLLSCFSVTALLEMYWNGVISYYYMNNLGLQIKHGALVWSIFSVYMILTSAFCGKISDRIKPAANGRRLPFIRVFGPFSGIAFALAFLPSFGEESQFLLALRLLLLLCAIDLSCSFVSTCLFAIPSEELTDLRSRSKMYAISSMLQLMGDILAVVIIPLVQPEKGSDTTVFSICMMAMGLLSAIVFYISARALPNTYKPNAEIIRSTSSLKSLRQCLCNRRFLIGEIFLTCTIIASAFLAFGLFYYLDECLVEIDEKIIIYVGMLLIGMALPYLCFSAAVRKFGQKRVIGLTGLISGAGLLMMYLTNGSLIGVLIGYMAMGISFVPQYFYNSILLTDFVDWDEEYSGIRKEGEYYGLDSLLDCAAVICQPIFLAIILAHGFSESLPKGMQSLEAQHGIMVGWLLTSAICMLAGSLLMLIFYPENGRHDHAVDEKKQ